MILVILFLIELTGLYFLARSVSLTIYHFAYLIFGSRTVAISLTTLIFFPGTVVHELSHLFTAEVLGVRTGKLSLVPENIEEEEVTAGSVQIAKTDPFRRYVIGFAPLIVGLVTVAALSYWLPQLLEEAFIRPRLASQGEALRIFATLFGTMYLLFVVSNSMFSSREDLKGFVGFTIAIGLIISAGYIAGIRIGLTEQAIAFINRILDGLVKSTGLVLAVNGILLLTIRVLLDLAGKLLHRRLRTH